MPAHGMEEEEGAAACGAMGGGGRAGGGRGGGVQEELGEVGCGCGLVRVRGLFIYVCRIPLDRDRRLTASG
jgi:hypothetical protein